MRNQLVGSKASKSLASVLAAAGLVSVPLVAFSFIKYQNIIDKAAPSEVIKRIQKKLTSLRPDWLSNPPSLQEVVALDRSTSYLPPIGGKFPTHEKDETQEMPSQAPRVLNPSSMAEEQSEKVIQYRREEAFGRYYVHQLTVQGRFPDRFKYAALALIMHSPYPNNWTKPFFEAEWGKVAPLVHDGGPLLGRVIRDYNPRWRGVKGRTDFIMRVFLVQEPELGLLEQKRPEELVQISVDRLAAARADQIEEERLRLEGRFYQRAAFALHAAIGTAPKSIPKEVRAAAADSWNYFEEQMKYLLIEYANGEIGNAIWFLDKPRAIKGWERYGKRHESEYLPIQEELIRLEEIRKQHPEIVLRVRQLLIDITEDIDQVIGLKVT